MLTIRDTGSEQHDGVGKDAKDHVAAEPLLHLPTHQAFPVVLKIVCFQGCLYAKLFVFKAVEQGHTQNSHAHCWHGLWGSSPGM